MLKSSSQAAVPRGMEKLLQNLCCHHVPGIGKREGQLHFPMDMVQSKERIYCDIASCRPTSGPTPPISIALNNTNINFFLERGGGMSLLAHSTWLKRPEQQTSLAASVRSDQHRYAATNWLPVKESSGSV